MTVYHYTDVLVWNGIGGTISLASGQSVTVTDPDTGTTAPGLTQNGQPVPRVTADTNGRVTFTAEMRNVRLTSPSGLSRDVVSPDAFDEVSPPGERGPQGDPGPTGDPGIAPNPWVEGCSLYSYGHSYTIYPGPYGTQYTGEHMERIRTRLNMGNGYFRGRSGTPLVDTLASMLSPTFGPPIGASGQRTWQFGSKGIVLLQNYMNEAGGGQGQSAQYRQMWANQLRAALAVYSSNVALPFASNNGVTGTWTRYGGASSAGSEVGDMFMADDLRFSGTSGASVSFPVTGDVAYAVVAISDPSYTIASMDFQVAGTTLGSYAPTGEGATFNSSIVTGLTGITIQAGVVKITGMNAAGGGSGTKNLVIKRTGSGNLFINGVILPSATPPYVYVAKEATRSPRNSGAANFANCRAYFEAAVDSIVAEFPNAFAVDLEPGWDDAMVGTLDTGNNFHPGDWGQKHIADRYCARIDETITGPINGVMTN